MIHRSGLGIVTDEIAVTGIPLQQPLPLGRPPYTSGNRLGQASELGTRRRPHRAEPHRAVGTLDVHPVEEQHVEVFLSRPLIAFIEAHL